MVRGERGALRARSHGARGEKRQSKEIHYPESDGEPIGETEVHVKETFRFFAIFLVRYRDRADVYVGADLIIYYREGEPRFSVSPDVFVAIGANKLPERLTYLLWQEKAPPTFVLEVTSSSTHREDLRKRDTYRALGVREYVLYDPLGEWLDPPLQGWNLDPSGDTPFRTAPEGGMISEALSLRLELVALPVGVAEPEQLPRRGRGRHLRREARQRWRLDAYDLASGERLLSPDEQLPIEAAARQRAEERARAGVEAQQALARRVAELEALLRERDAGVPGAGDTGGAR